MIDVEDLFDKAKLLAGDPVFVDAQSDVGLRISQHPFNTDDETEYALETIARHLA